MHKRNALLIFLLFLLATPMLFAVYTIVEEQRIEYAMEAALEEQSLETVMADAGTIVWVKLNKEAIINGRMFDVKSILRNGQKLTLTGLFDAREDRLHKKMHALHLQRNRPGAAKTSLLLLLFAGYHQQSLVLHLHSPEIILSRASSLFIEPAHYNAFKEVSSPPPRYGQIFLI